MSEQSIPVRQYRIVDVQVLQDLNDRERSAREDRLHELRGVEEPDVLVHVEDVFVG